MTREALLSRTMVELADNLVDDFDIVELLSTLSERCVDILDIAAAGIMLADADGNLRAMTSSNEARRVVELGWVKPGERIGTPAMVGRPVAMPAVLSCLEAASPGRQQCCHRAQGNPRADGEPGESRVF